MNEMLSENDNISSMRVALLATVAMAAIMVLSLCVYLVMSLFKGVDVNWNGISIFLAAIGVFVAPAFVGKAIQKNYE